MLLKWLAEWKRVRQQAGLKKRKLRRRPPLAVEILEKRTLLTTFYVDNAADFVITIDQGASGLDAGDTVTWDSGATHSAGPAEGLIFGTHAFASLQDAVDQAASGGDPIDTINIAAGTFVENVSINTSVEILGTAGTIVDGNQAGSVFTISSGNMVTINALTIQNGSAANGGGILNEGNLTLESAIVQNNTADGGGGGIWNGSGTMMIDGATIDGNTSAAGGGLFNDAGTVNLSGTTISNNDTIVTIDDTPDPFAQLVVAGDGGGIFNNAGATLNLDASTVTGNETLGDGGGIANRGTLTVTHSTIDSNQARGAGGGIASPAGFSPATTTVTLINVTISGNTAHGEGGGIFMGAGNLTINNSTIVSNNVVAFTGLSPSGQVVGMAEGGGIFHDGLGTVTLDSTIVAGNIATTISPENIASSAAYDIGGVVSGTFNLIGVSTGLVGLTDGVDGNLIGTADNPINPRLGPLADNGGPTLTHALLPSSPAINAGGLAGDIVPIFDQRGEGFDRTFGSQTDIGAFEVQAAAEIDFLVTAPDSGTPGIVRVALNGVQLYQFEPFPGFLGGVRVAVGDVNNDGTPDIIAAAGPGGGPHVKVISGADGTTVLLNFFAYDPAFAGGVYVASGDVNGDGFADIITGADAGGGPHVRVFSGDDGSTLFNFFAFDERFQGGVRVAAGDVTGDGTPDIIAAAGPGGGPHVRIFDGSVPITSGAGTNISGAIGSFFAYDTAFAGGVFVAAGDVDGDGQIDIITGAGLGAGPHVRVFDGATGLQLSGPLGSFYAYDPIFLGGVRVAVTDFDHDGMADIITTPGPGGGPHLRVFDADSVGTPQTLADVFVGDPSLTFGLSVAASMESAVSSSLDELFSDGDVLGGMLNE